MASETDVGLRFERAGAIASLTLDRAASGNAIDVHLARTLMEAAIRCDEDEGIRCVVLRGSGRMFCAGGDINEFGQAGENVPAYMKRITGYLHSAIARLARMNKPLVTSINGPAAGAGFSLAILGDIAIASRSAHFTLAYSAIGLTPDGGATWLLPRLVGLRLAQEIALTNRRIGADEAAAIGLVSRTVADGELDKEVAAAAETLAASATSAVGTTRNLLLESFTNSLETHMERESRAIAAASRTPAGREGIAAFLAKRKPDFTQ